MLCFDAAGDNAKVIVVFGSTGQQGGSVVRAIKDDRNFIVKAATRNTKSKEAQQLAAEGEQINLEQNCRTLSKQLLSVSNHSRLRSPTRIICLVAFHTH